MTERLSCMRRFEHLSDLSSMLPSSSNKSLSKAPLVNIETNRKISKVGVNFNPIVLRNNIL